MDLVGPNSQMAATRKNWVRVPEVEARVTRSYFFCRFVF